MAGPIGSPILAEANDILIDFDGQLAYLTSDKLYVYSSSDTNIVLSTWISPEMDLNEPSIDKLINFIDVDYIGAFTIQLEFDGIEDNTMSQYFSPVSVRTSVWRHFPLRGRIPFKKVKLTITSSTPGTIIYGIEIDFSVLRRRRYN